MMNVRSDNAAGAHPLIIDALRRAFTSGSPASFGEDEWTRRVALGGSGRLGHRD